MLSIQHILCGLLATNNNKDKFKELIPSLVYPDAIRCYSKQREYSHFEESADGTDVSYWKLPVDMKNLTQEIIDDSISAEAHLAKKPATAIGEVTRVDIFERHNKHLPKKIFDGIKMHLIQDSIYDEFIREQIDCRGKYRGVYKFDDREYNSEEVRKLITSIEEEGILILAKEIYEWYGVIVDMEWVEREVYPVIKSKYSKHMADTTCKYMTISEKTDIIIKTRSWDRKTEWTLDIEDYNRLYSRMLKDTAGLVV